MNNAISAKSPEVQTESGRRPILLGARGRSILALGMLVLVAFISLANLFPLKVTPASAPGEVFSGERALAHLAVIASEPHPAGSPAQAAVRDYLVQQLTALGLDVEVQQAPGLDNVVARLYGSDPSGAILLQAHYDSRGGPGAADNGAGVAALLEIMRALAAGPALRNDIIVLFDDSEEMPDAFTGTKVFIRKHRWMADVRVAVGLDTAAKGFICTDDTGSENGWMVGVLARAYTGGAWTSLCGGGHYDTAPFRMAGIQVLEMEDNYPFHEQHTPGDVPEIVRPGTMQQLGEQALGVVRVLGGLGLENTRGEQQTYMFVPLVGLVHYPEAWALPLAILAGILLLIALGLALWRRLASWRGLAVALLATLASAGLAAVGTNAVWKAAPRLFGWETQRWPDWPEVIPPNGWLIFILSNLAVLLLAVVIYGISRRWSSGASFSLAGLVFFLVLAVGVAVSDRRGAILFTWPVLVGAAAWITGATPGKDSWQWLPYAGAVLAAIPIAMFILPLVPAVFMGDGTKSVAITAGVWGLMLSIILPAIDGLFGEVMGRGRR